jgi:hypothetical protein
MTDADVSIAGLLHCRRKKTYYILLTITTRAPTHDVPVYNHVAFWSFTVQVPAPEEGRR